MIPYPLIFLMSWGGMVIYYLYYDFTNDEPYILVLISGTAVKLQGFFNCVVYGLNTTVRQAIKESISNCGNTTVDDVESCILEDDLVVTLPSQILE